MHVILAFELSSDTTCLELWSFGSRQTGLTKPAFLSAETDALHFKFFNQRNGLADAVVRFSVRRRFSYKSLRENRASLDIP